MRVEIGNIGIGHAPRVAKCSIGVEFSFDEDLLIKLPKETVDRIKRADGELPEEISLQVAEDGCDHFVLGKCLIQDGIQCSG